MTETETRTPAERVLFVMAHPDDVDFGCAGTVATWVDEGMDVTYCIVTDGHAGGSDRDLPRLEMAQVRRNEQRAAAKVLGVTDVRFLGYPDGAVYVTHELRRDISRVIRAVRPNRVVCQSPQRAFLRIYGSHPDHLAAAEATLCAVYPDARNPFAHPELLAEGLEPWTVPETWLAGGPDPDAFVDVTDHFANKIAALRAHESQTGHMDDLEDRIRTWMVYNAGLAGATEDRLVEAYRKLDTT